MPASPLKPLRSSAQPEKLLTSRVIGVAANAWLTGQPLLAPSAASANSCAVMPGTVPLTLRTIPVMPVPGWKVTSAEVSIAVGGVPALARAFERAIEKQVACAAPSSSSGLVLPFASFAREGQLTSNVPTPEDSRVTWPAPSSRAVSYTHLRAHETR